MLYEKESSLYAMFAWGIFILGSVNLMRNSSNICVHIPHSRTKIPSICKKEFLIDDEKLQDQLLHMTDWYTDDLFRHHSSVIFPYSRLICDVERFLDPIQENMIVKGMGMYYTLGYDGFIIKESPFVYDYLLPVYKYCLDLYYNHHYKLSHKIDDILAEFNSAILIDAHSFSSIALPYEGKDAKKTLRPDICLGIDDIFTPFWLRNIVKLYFEKEGFNVLFNTPFSGTLVPIPFYGLHDTRVSSIMIEVNRKLYMDEQTGKKNNNFKELHKIISGLYNVLRMDK